MIERSRCCLVALLRTHDHVQSFPFHVVSPPHGAVCVVSGRLVCLFVRSAFVCDGDLVCAWQQCILFFLIY
jgi:hypothetical protein